MSYKPPFKPYAHQATAHKRLDTRPMRPSNLDVMAWLMEYGTGKTKVVLDEFGMREDAKDLQDLIVIAPAGVYLNWRDIEMPKHLSGDLQERMMTVAWRSGGSKKPVEALLANKDSRRPRCLIINVEAMSRVEKAIVACRTMLEQGRRCMVVVDEATTIKGDRSQRSENIVELGQLAAARRIATGLVTPKSPMDLYAQFKFLDWRILGFQSYFGYRARYAVLKKEMFFAGIDDEGNERFKQALITVGYRHVDELHAKIAPYSYRVLKKDCLDLPDKVYQFYDIEPTDEQRKIYEELRDYAFAELAKANTTITATMVITRMLRCHQVLTGHVRDDEGNVHGVKNNRITELIKILDGHNGKAIIWAPYDYCIQDIARELKKEFGDRSVARFWGGNNKTREDEEKMWRMDPQCKYMVSTQSAGGAGRTWIEADLVVYYASTHNLEHRMNSEDRAHRAGQTRKVTYIDMRVRDSVEDKIIMCLRKKLDMATLITGENYRSWLV